MGALELLADLRKRGVELVVAGERIRYRPKDALTPELHRALVDRKAELLAELASEAAWAQVERIAERGNEKGATALALDAAGAHDQAERLRAEVRETVTRDWLPAMRRWARAADRAGQLPEADQWLLEDADDGGEVVNGYRRVRGGWVETEERARRCVIHAHRPLAPCDKLLCAGCRAAADAMPGPDVGRPSLPVPPGVAPDDPRLRELTTVAALAAAHRDAAGGEGP